MATNLRLQSAALIVLLLVSSIGAPASADEAFVDPKQPSVDNPHMHVYGNSDLSNCFMHFDGNDSTGSAEEGYGEQVWPEQANQQIEMDYTCRISENFKQDMYLNNNGTIQMKLDFQIDADDCADGAGGGECLNLTLTLYKGGIELAMEEFPAVDNNGNDDSLTWNIDVDRNMTRFNRSGEEPQLRVQYSHPGYNPTLGGCFVWKCGGYFRMYYATTNGSDTGIVNFPIINQSMPGDGGDDDDGGLGAVGDALPGFGLMAGMSALAMAAVAGSRRVRKE
jgi:hypothetical protein